MEIQFKSTGAASGFETWLNAFKPVSKTLLIEIDTEKGEFLARCPSEEKTVLKSGHITFEDAGFEVLKMKDDSGNDITIDDFNASLDKNDKMRVAGHRILFGINEMLPKFINVVSMFNGASEYKVSFKFTEVENELPGTYFGRKADDSVKAKEFAATRAEFKSPVLTMRVDGADIVEFKKRISDTLFANRVITVQKPMEFELDIETVKMLISVSGILPSDMSKELLDFKTVKDGDEWTLHAVNHGDGSYDYKIARMKDGGAEEPAETLIPVNLSNFILSTKGDIDNEKIIISGVPNDGTQPGKVRLDCGDFITTIASVRVS